MEASCHKGMVDGDVELIAAKLLELDCISSG